MQYYRSILIGSKDFILSNLEKKEKERLNYTSGITSGTSGSEMFLSSQACVVIVSGAGSSESSITASKSVPSVCLPTCAFCAFLLTLITPHSDCSDSSTSVVRGSSD